VPGTSFSVSHGWLNQFAEIVSVESDTRALTIDRRPIRLSRTDCTTPEIATSSVPQSWEIATSPAAGSYRRGRRNRRSRTLTRPSDRSLRHPVDARAGGHGALSGVAADDEDLAAGSARGRVFVGSKRRRDRGTVDSCVNVARTRYVEPIKTRDLADSRDNLLGNLPRGLAKFLCQFEG
jgi:hypothetical protein